MNLANKITMLRILLVPVFIVFLKLNFPYKNFIVTAIFVLISLTDALDGYIARKRKQVTDFGKVMDPIADKLLIAGALIYLVSQARIVPWMAFIIISRELLVTGLRIVVSHKKVIIAASVWGKLKTITLIIAICAVMLRVDALMQNWFMLDTFVFFGKGIAYSLMFIATIITIISGIDYFVKAKKKGIY